MLKKGLCLLLIGIILCVGNPVLAQEESSTTFLYVSASAQEGGNGSAENPFRTIKEAQQAVRRAAPDMQGDIVINIDSGNYFLEEPLRFTVEDSGRNGYRVIYRGDPTNMPVISGGFSIFGFEESPEMPGVWQTQVEGVEQIRSLYINGEKRFRASADRKITPIGTYIDPNSSNDMDGLYISKHDLGFYQNQSDIELRWGDTWVTLIGLVDRIIPDPENDEQVILILKNGLSNSLVTSPFEISNALELLDSPGEFYYDKQLETLYYLPMPGEDLSTAEIIVPRLEKLMTITGNDIDDKVKNISFEGLQFSHSAFYALGEDNSSTYQAQVYGTSDDIPGHIPGAITLDRVDGVTFNGNYFFGIESAGVDLKNAVENTRVDGNAFSDIGNAAVVVGRYYHGDAYAWYGKIPLEPGTAMPIEWNGEGAAPPLGTSEAPPENPPSQYNLINGEVKVAFSTMKEMEQYGVWGLRGDRIWVYPDEYNLEHSCISRPEVVEKGEKTWIRYDFEEPVSISQIRLGFDTSKISAEQRSGFEILLSNDKFFTEGNYTVVAQQHGPAGQLADYTPPEDGEKYQYLMIRTLDATEFAISGVWAFTPDKELYTRFQRNKNNSVSNNYICRVSDTIFSGGGIGAYYNENLTINHNEIIDVPYSAIMSGWGWSRLKEGTSGISISYNYLKNVTLCVPDGGGIYTLADHPNSIVAGNVIDNVWEGRGALYPDEGSSYMRWEDNVSMDAPLNWHIWIDTIQYNTFGRLFANHTDSWNYGTNNQWQPEDVFLPGFPPPDAYEIINNAGLEPQYSYLRDLVYEAEINILDQLSRSSMMVSREQYQTSLLEESAIMLEYGTFGTMPWQYPSSYKPALEEERAALETAIEDGLEGNDLAERLISLRRLMREAGEAIQHPSLDDLLSFCYETLETAVTYQPGQTDVPLGAYPQAELEEFRGALEQVGQDTESLTAKEQYAKVLDLEDAYNTLEATCAEAVVFSAEADGMNRSEILEEEKKVILYFPDGFDLSCVNVNLTAAQGSIIATQLENVNLEQPRMVPVYSIAAQKYVYWELEAQHGGEQEEWYIPLGETSILEQTDNAYMQFTPYAKPVMYSYSAGFDKREFSFRFAAVNEKSELTWILGAERSEGFEETDAHFEFVVTASEGLLYQSQNGEEKLLAKCTLPNSSEGWYRMGFQITPQTDGTRIQIWINDKQGIDSISRLKVTANYFGIHCTEMPVTIQQLW